MDLDTTSLDKQEELF